MQPLSHTDAAPAATGSRGPGFKGPQGSSSPAFLGSRKVSRLTDTAQRWGKYLNSSNLTITQTGIFISVREFQLLALLPSRQEGQPLGIWDIIIKE